MTLRKLLGKYDRKLRKIYNNERRHPEKYKDAVSAADFYESASSALKAAKGFISSYGEKGLMPLFLLCKAFFYENKRVTRMKLENFFSDEKLSLFQCEALPVLLYAAAGAVISESYPEKSEQISSCVRNLFYLRTVPFNELFYNLNSAERCLYEDPASVYEKMSEKTKRFYRRTVIKQAEKEGLSEEQYVRKILNKAENKNKHIGFFMPLIKNGRRAGFVYIVSEWLISLAVSVFISIFADAGILIFPVFILPVYAVIRPFSDFLSSKIFPPRPVFAMDKSSISEAQVLVTVTSILPEKEDSEKLFSHLSDIYSSVFIKGMKLLFLADLKSSPSPEKEGDKENISAVKSVIDRLNKKYSGGFSLIIRERVFSPTENEFTGYERKRGALSALMRFLRDGNKETFGTVYGDTEGFPEMKYVMALDSDTNMNFDSLRELLSVAYHPLNKPYYDSRKGRVVSGYGIFSPAVSVSLFSGLGTLFSSVFTDSGTNQYVSSVSERNQDLLGEGIFSGKGLIDTAMFDKVCGDRFDKGRILSHDILEGSVLRTCFCPSAELSDSFPASPKSWFLRLHRWIRGDVQNLKYIFFPLGKEKQSPSLPRVGKYQLFENFRRAVTPVTGFVLLTASVFFSEKLSFALASVSVLSLISDSLFSALYVLFRKGLSVFFVFGKDRFTSFQREIIRMSVTLGAYPLFFLYNSDAVIRSAYRSLVSKKKLLSWCTAADTEKMKKLCIFKEIVFPSAVSLLFIVAGNFIHIVTAVFILLFIPFSVFGGIKISRKKIKLSGEDKTAIEALVSSMWKFFSENITENENFLPPDNISYYSGKRVAGYTSPTNIGLYLVCILAAADMSIISPREMNDRINKTLDTIDKLPKYKGHLYNWYNIVNASAAPPEFVSSVDCGNFLTCLTALKEGLYEFGDREIEKTALRIEKMLFSSDLSVFYDKTRELFSIGIDSSSGQLHESFYEHYMSESRMGSFFAVSRRQVPSSHWSTLSRTVKRYGSIEVPLSWTGTMFEYFMPRLFMPSYEGTFHREGLLSCLYMQRKAARRRKIPYGMSESAYFDFDEMKNYRYKAHGVKELAVSKNVSTQSVISPYSVFLAMPLDPKGALGNLSRLSSLHVTGKYGFYEAADFSGGRAEIEAPSVVRSFMSHHVGMSMIAAVSTLKDDIFVKRFMRDIYMNSAKSLLEEKSIT